MGTQSEVSSSPDRVQGDLKAFPEAVITEPSFFQRAGGKTFEIESLASYHKPIDESYEGYHRYDPDFQWEGKEEKRVVRRIDYRICSWVCLMFFALQLDRGNISQALSDNMLEDLGISTNAYNTGQTIFYLNFLFAELPSQLISKKIGPDNWIPIQMVSWSLVASMQACLSGRSSFWACRALLGLIEGGFIPDNILYLSYFYTGRELPRRLSFFWVAFQRTSIVSAFLAFGILHMWGINGMAGWRDRLLLLPPTFANPNGVSLPSRFRGKEGWFSEREEKIMVNRVLRDDPSKGDMHNRQELNLGMLWQCLKDYHMWPIYLIGLSWMIPAVPMNNYLTLQLKSVGFGTFETNLLTIPAYVILIMNRSPWVAWILSCLVFAMPYFHASGSLSSSRNAGSVRTRTVASAIYNMTVQASNIIGSNIYRTPDKPTYYTGNKVLIGIICYNIALFVGAKFSCVNENKKRDAIWSAMSKEQKEGRVYKEDKPTFP
ncbi:hypothetical protein CLAFUW4_01239 [Fulvia fulva]|uniref:Phthalate transporter n=1 Tax=Passalora fulva TaxID=5499 RepID=A0A9Q8L857_PASFU|nr:uncharacterized protein CLAFUR5_01244 [Fulvia fulva]KAK4634420.1 hypothetical protein CLAFUR4_01240 [Fulvia fulva]KAK4638474.1 hypothetical protein CLAFUR0_01241 [Fulvia fulva]UJO12681.1 hypothetical protein CLAFUR5_01244 [Fulvia fulva]WPV08588.1 hypothetical protein CLAFUW4_01239 [Fulvia fulva]WPV24344.1 hypothetical protein CLAFUW7_01244 [Fulvia fulva]